MAEHLLRNGLADGIVFHAYHAYECIISALIAANGVRVSTSHSSRFILFYRLGDKTKPYAATQRQLQHLTVQVRNASLYYDERRDRLPTDEFSIADATRVLPVVHEFAREVWRENR